MHDPEGILGHLTSCYLTYLGLQAGKWFSYYPNFKEKKQFRLLAGHFIAGALIIGTIGQGSKSRQKSCTTKIVDLGFDPIWVLIRTKFIVLKCANFTKFDHLETPDWSHFDQS